MITWRYLRNQLNRLSDEELDMAVSFFIDLGPAGYTVADAEDGIEIYEPSEGEIPELATGQPHIKLEADL